MQKIPTVFKRDPENMRRVLPEITLGCEWVLAGEGVPTRKYDGTCVLFEADADWWARREVKPGMTPPADFRAVSTDPTTGKTVGWEPMAQSGFAKWHAEAIADRAEWDWQPGTYELCGPKVNGNPEGYDEHTLIRHADAGEVFCDDRSFAGIRDLVLALLDRGVEGLVYHHPDGRMAKIKGRDFEPPHYTSPATSEEH